MDHLDDYKDDKYPTVTLPPISIKKAAKAAWKKIQKYYVKTNNHHTVVTLLDPRCNVEYFQENGFTEEQIDEYKTR